VRTAAQGFDVIVIGGGHAGTETAVAAARRGARVALLTTSLETIGQLSCNPAIDGVAKGTVVREIDALGGIMARATDLASLQFRMLNPGKGPAVWAPRAQVDRGLHRSAIQRLVRQQPKLALVQGSAARLVLGADGEVSGVETADLLRLSARAVVICTGTFLRGRIHIGTAHSISGGRAGEPATVTLAEQFAEIGLETSRFKTGTPPRIDGRSVDFAHLDRQENEIEAFDFSWSASWTGPRRCGDSTRHPEQLPCWLTRAGPEVNQLVQERLHESATYGGSIGARGPRYCPSIENEVVRFAEAERHLLYLEPEGLDTNELYVNGPSISLPADAQLEMLRAIPELESAIMTRPGNAIEYCFVPPTQLHSTLATRALPELFLTGQINGTTGYDEVGAQGVLAGANAAAHGLDVAPLVLGRASSYLGVLVDDLFTRGVDEPPRLLASRSEFRLSMRQDNAVQRLSRWRPRWDCRPRRSSGSLTSASMTRLRPITSRARRRCTRPCLRKCSRRRESAGSSTACRSARSRCVRR